MSEEASETIPVRDQGGSLWTLLLIAGPAIAGIAAFLCYLHATPGGLFMLGFGTVATGVGYALHFSLESGVRSVTIGPRGVTIASLDGSSADLPRAAITEARVHTIEQRGSSSPRTASTLHHYVHLCKRDGGVLDLGHQADKATAEQLAKDVNRLLQKWPAEAAAPGDALAILAQSKRVIARRDEGSVEGDYRHTARSGDLVLDWPVRPTHIEFVTGILCPAGLAFGFYGAHLSDGAIVPLVGAGIGAAIGVGILARLLWLLGARQVLRVGAKDLTIERRRGERRLSHKAIPLDAVRTVDFSFKADTLSGTLDLHLSDARPPQLPQGEERSMKQALRLARDVVAFARDTVQISLGPLRFGDKVRIDLALSAEIAQRTGRDEAEV